MDEGMDPYGAGARGSYGGDPQDQLDGGGLVAGRDLQSNGALSSGGRGSNMKRRQQTMSH